MIEINNFYQVKEIKKAKRFNGILNRYKLTWTTYEAHSKKFCVAHYENRSFVYSFEDYKDCCFDALKYALFQEFTIKNQSK